MDRVAPLDQHPSRLCRTLLPSLLVLALLLPVSTPSLAQQAPPPLEETVASACANPGLQSEPARGPVDQRPSGIHGGCQTWSHDAPTSAVQALRDDNHVLAAGIQDGTLTVTRLHADSGDLIWEAQIPATNGEQINVVLDDDNEVGYLGWHTYPHRWESSMTRSPHQTTFHPGGIAKVHLDDGTLAWRHAPGSTAIALSPEGDRLYHATTTEGLYPEEHARLETMAIDTETGNTQWTNASSLWWSAHAPLLTFETPKDVFCDAGPADIEVHPNGTIFVARSQACNLVPGALLGYAPNGTLTHAWTYPVPLGEHDPDPLPITETRLALHPAGHILYAVSTHHVAAYHTLTREQLWAWTSDDLVKCSEITCTAPQGAGVWHSKGFPGGLDAETTPSGDLIISAFDESILHGHDLVPRLLYLDGVTGEPIAREPPQVTMNANLHPHHPDSTMNPGRFGSPLTSEISLDTHGLFAFVSYQAGTQGRVLGYPLTGDQIGPTWEAYEPHPAENTWTLDETDPLKQARAVTSTDKTVVIAGPNTTGHTKGLLLEALANAHQPTSASLRNEIETGAQRTLTAAVHGNRIVEGTPTLLVRSSDSIHAHVNVTEPGVYYLLVEGLEAGERYALHAPHGAPPPAATPTGLDACTPHTPTQPHVHPYIYDHATWTVDHANDPCQRSDPGLCEADIRTRAARPPGYLEDNCWTTGERGPVTVTRADREDDENAQNGSALFGPLVITEGDYAVVRAPPLEPLNPGPSLDAAQDAADGCAVHEVSSLGAPTGYEGLEACIEVRLEPGEQNPPSVPQQTHSSSSRGSWEDNCRYELDHIAAVSTVETDPRPGRAEGRILQSSVNMIGLGIERYAENSGACGVHAGYAQSVGTFYLNGSTEFRGTTEWRAAFNLACLIGWDSTGCKSSDSSASIQLRKPSSCIPDEEGLYVHELPGPPGTTGADRERSNFLTAIAKRIVHEITGQPLFWAIERTHEGLKLAEDYFFQKDCEREWMTACGLGCQEWSWSVSGNEQFLHRLNMRASGCGTIEYPVTWGLEKGILRFETARGTTVGWTLPGAFVDQSFPVTVEECGP